MKQNIKLLIGFGSAIAILGAGCKKSFFNRPPENQLTVGTYYQTVAQVQASSDILYAAPWFGLNGKAFLAIGDLQGGNAICYAGTDGSFDPFRSLSTEGNATAPKRWRAPGMPLYTVIAQSNELLLNLPGAARSVSTPPRSTMHWEEARLMRAAAYFYLVRQFGNVPIITNPTASSASFTSVPSQSRGRRV